MKKVLTQLFQNIFSISNPDQWQELFSTQKHTYEIKQNRAVLLNKRTWFFAFLFGLLVPLWIIIDMLLLPEELVNKLVLLRLVSCFIFLAIANQCYRQDGKLHHALFYLAILLLTPSVFFLFSHPLFSSYQLSGFAFSLMELYELLPFIAVAALAIFPLTIKEFFAVSTPVIVITAITLFPQSKEALPYVISQMWLLFLIIGISLLSSLSQMRFLISQISRASYDPLTRAMTRRAGIESIEIFYRLAILHHKYLSVILLEVDHFKGLNSKHGNKFGDELLQQAVKTLTISTRKGDSIIRWGSAEFMVLLPNSNGQDSMRVVERIYQHGFGITPDGQKITASMGMAVTGNGEFSQWEELVELASYRLSLAQKTGRARCVGNNDEQKIAGIKNQIVYA